MNRFETISRVVNAETTKDVNEITTAIKTNHSLMRESLINFAKKLDGRLPHHSDLTAIEISGYAGVVGMIDRELAVYSLKDNRTVHTVFYKLSQLPERTDIVELSAITVAFSKFVTGALALIKRKIVAAEAVRPQLTKDIAELERILG